MANNNNNLQGICPHCRSEQLSYGTIIIDDCGVKYPYICENCGTKGNEAYNLEFDGHYDVQLEEN